MRGVKPVRHLPILIDPLFFSSEMVEKLARFRRFIAKGLSSVSLIDY